MVGIYKKIKKILSIVQQYAPILDKFVPGVGTLVKSVAQVGDGIADGVNNVYEDYTSAKKSGSKYGFFDGVKSFGRAAGSIAESGVSSVKNIQPAMKTLTRTYGQLHPRLKLKDET
jgi:phage-related protein